MLASIEEVKEATTTPVRREASPRRCAVLIFLVFSFFYLMTSSGRVRTMDEYMSFFETESIVVRHSTAVPQAVQLNYYYGKYDLRGKPRPPYPPGQPLVAAPWYTFGRYVFERLPGVPAIANPLVLGAAACFSNACISAAIVAFLFLICNALGLNQRRSFYVAGMVGIATPVFAYSSWFYSEPLTTALMMAAAYFVFAWHIGKLVPIRAAAIGGVLLGFAVFVRPIHVLAPAVFFVALLLRDRAKAMWSALTLGVGSAAGLGLLLVYNFQLFGNALDFGYPAVAEGGRRMIGFTTPLLMGLYGFLFSPGKSIFLFAPPLLLAIFGLPRLWKKDRGLATVAVGLLVAYLAFYVKYTQWEGGYCVGPRYLMPTLALFCIALVPVFAELNNRTRVVAIVLTILGAAVQIISIATSFMESQVPAGVYYDRNWNYQINYSIGSQVQVLMHHLMNRAPAGLGLGFDRWFVFLAKVGVSQSTLLAIFCVMLAGEIASAVALHRTLKQAA
ncbi:MAG: hypothetical protein WB607_09570 [Candidatus Acidiferrum sp.]